MTELVSQTQTHARSAGANKKVKFIIGGIVIAIAIVYLIFTTTQSTAAYFLTVEELYDKGDAIYGRNVRVSGKVPHLRRAGGSSGTMPLDGLSGAAG